MEVIPKPHLAGHPVKVPLPPCPTLPDGWTVEMWIGVDRPRSRGIRFVARAGAGARALDGYRTVSGSGPTLAAAWCAFKSNLGWKLRE